MFESGEVVAFSDYMGLSEKQRQVLACATSHPMATVAYGGAGGGGKSYLVRAASVYFLLKLFSLGFNNRRVVLASTTYPQLRDRHYSYLNQEYSWLGKIKESKTYGDAFVVHDRVTRATGFAGAVCLRNLDDPDKYRGGEYAALTWDEASEVPEFINGQRIMGLMRYPIRDRERLPFLPLVIATNPDGVGHSWLKSLFITGSDRQGLDEASVFYVPARVEDNPCEAIRETFKKTLEQLPEHLRKARLEGSWDSPQGARFKQADAAVHLFDFKERFPYGIPANWIRIIGVDYGIANPYCALWTAIDYDGNAWTYREDYSAGLYSHEQALRIRNLTLSDERISALYVDEAMMHSSPNPHGSSGGDVPIVQVYEDVLGKDERFGRIVPGYKASRIHSFNTIDKLLSRDNDYPNWYISKDCTNLWRELTGAVFDTRGIAGRAEDIDKRLGDHAIDAARYSLHTWYETPKKLLTKEDQIALATLREEKRYHDKFAKPKHRRVIRL